MALDLTATGLYLRKPGGNVEDSDGALGLRRVGHWSALNIGGDVGRDPTVWAYQRSLNARFQHPDFPWLHCRDLGDIDFLIDVGLGWASPAIGFNYEDVQRDFVDKGIGVHDVAARLARWTGLVHMPILPWAQNGKSWQLFARCVAALEIMADEQLNTFPTGQPDPAIIEDCIEHAFAEGLKTVTLMLKTKAPWKNSDYPHYTRSLFTADDVTPLAAEWSAWEDPPDVHLPKPPPSPPEVPVPPVVVRFTRVIAPGDVGVDVEEVARALCREGSGAELKLFMQQKLERRRLQNSQKRDWLKKFERKHGLKVDGVYGKDDHLVLSSSFDARGRKGMASFKLPPPPLIEPKQGFDSLTESLWDEYTACIRLGGWDLGTYNPKSTLPSSGKPSDHASCDGAHIREPACAFDIGFSPPAGMDSPLGRRIFTAMVGNPQVEYVICGKSIWSQDKGLHAYTSGGHESHVHVSARH